MRGVPRRPAREGLKAARLLMVLSSISPLFILWGIRGTTLVSDYYFALVCALLVIVPNLFLFLRIQTAKRLQEKREIVVGRAEDHREHLLVYLFAMLLPFYTAEINTWRDLLDALAALGFIIFLFWHLNLHYMNLLFAAWRYRVFTVYPPADDNPLSGRESQVLISRRVTVPDGERLIAYRLSDTVYLDGE
jgi:hypothetical protein